MNWWILFVTAFALLSGPTLYAQDISGNWQGTLLAANRGPFAKLRIFLKIAKAESGDWKAVVYSVDQGGAPIPVTSITLENLALQFSIDPLHSQYNGRLNADGVRDSQGHIQSSTLRLGRLPSRKEERDNQSGEAR
jgi:hypothetical protein